MYEEGVDDEIVPQSCPMAAMAFKVGRWGSIQIIYVCGSIYTCICLYLTESHTQHESNPNHTQQSAAEGGYWAAASRFGLDLYKRGDYTGAVAILSMAAEEGYELAQANAAWLLEHRMGYRWVWVGG